MGAAERPTVEVPLKFSHKLRAATKRNSSFLCIGLDPDPRLIPHNHIPLFIQEIVEATADLVCAYKPNLAFFEALGTGGMNVLLEALQPVPAHIPIIADAKRGDVGNSSRFYAQAIFEQYEFDALTVNPYGGHDSLAPFTEYAGKGIFVWCRGSNPGSADFQDLALEDGRRLYEAVAQKAAEWNVNGNVNLVVGATRPEELRRVREICPEMWILSPGVGAQQGELQATVEAGLDGNGEGLIINASRSILYARRDDYRLAARQAAEQLRGEINLQRDRVLAQRE